MKSQAIINVSAQNTIAGKVEKLSGRNLFISVDKSICDTSILTTGNQYHVDIIDAAFKYRLPCQLLKFDSELIYLEPLRG